MPTPRLALPYIVQGQAQKEVTHSRLFKALMTAHVPRWRAMDAARRGARGVSPAAHASAEQR